MLQIVVAPSPILRQKAEPVAAEELASLRSVARQMAKLMYKSQGCGLAAPQVGLSKRLIVVDTDQHEDERGRLVKNPHCYVNPVITQAWGEEEQSDEGCLSVPGISIPIKRPSNVVMEALDLDGQPLTV
ncbi:MAG: peptide deformylase, partial [Coriobacteriales bacterium]|nr:peptide deformylase [Coriobacteriales bacterium]